MHYRTLSHNYIEATMPFTYGNPVDAFRRVYQSYNQSFIFESKDVSPVYGRMSFAGVDPSLRIVGKDNHFSIEVLNGRGEHILSSLTEGDFSFADSVTFETRNIEGIVEKAEGTFEETLRSKQKNISQVVRMLIQKFAQPERGFFGLYGAFSYDFVRLFEDLGDNLPENEIPDFELFLYDTFLFYDHLKERADIIAIRPTQEAARTAAYRLQQAIMHDEMAETIFAVRDQKFTLSQNQYEALVEQARTYAKQGELFEVVFANKLTASFEGDPFALYLKYRDINPSPYLFYMDFGKHQLVGASPEMMVRVEHGKVHMRPISGTAKRGKDPIEDHENMLALLSNSKERAELDMLIDLGRNDLSRVCKPGVAVSDYRFVEKYSRVMHTVAHVSGELKDEYTALDALIACLNAGTLTGAPKVAAMRAIERHEQERRGFYGGTIGYLTFSGELDSGIIIRTAHIQGDHLSFQVGATLLNRSVPAEEYAETENKARAFLDTVTV